MPVATHKQWTSAVSKFGLARAAQCQSLCDDLFDLRSYNRLLQVEVGGLAAWIALAQAPPRQQYRSYMWIALAQLAREFVATPRTPCGA